MKFLMKLREIRKNAKLSESNLIKFLFTHYYLKRKFNINVFLQDNVKVINPQNISTNGLLKIGVDYYGFTLKTDKTLLRINGKLIVNGKFSIGKGCRFDIEPNSIVELGSNSYFSPNTTVIISYGLKIGNDCAISWGCQFLDNDFHKLNYDNKTDLSDKKIVIGDHVWIGSNTSIYKGVKIPNGCVVAANSVVKKSFNEENLLIGGNPAQVLKHNIMWER